MLSRKKTLRAKIESTYGTAPALADTDAILTKGLSITPYNGNRVGRDLDRSTLGLDAEINVAPNVGVSFEVELAGSGTAGTAPRYGQLLRACAFAEVISAGTSVEYRLVSGGFESVTLEYEQDGQVHTVVGARGTVSFDFSAQAVPLMKFNFTGLYKRPVAGSLSTDLSGFQVPLPVTEAATPVYRVHGYDAIASSLTLDLANEVKHRNLVNEEGVLITDRAPTGQLVIDAPTLAQKNMFSLVESHNGFSTGAVLLEHGTDAGNIVSLSAPSVQLSSIDNTDVDGNFAYQIGTRYLPVNGDDEFVLIVK